VTEAASLIRSNVLRGIVVDIFRLMLKLEVEPVAAAPRAPSPGTKVTGVVSMSSAVEDPSEASFAVILEMSENLAFRVVGAMLQQEVNSWSELAEDACGEIANMIAGNAKKHLVNSHVLSMPTVIVGVDYKWCLPNLHLKQVECFSCGGESFKVMIGEEKRKTA